MCVKLCLSKNKLLRTVKNLSTSGEVSLSGEPKKLISVVNGIYASLYISVIAMTIIHRQLS